MIYNITSRFAVLGYVKCRYNIASKVWCVTFRVHFAVRSP